MLRFLHEASVKDLMQAAGSSHFSQHIG